MFFTLAGSGAHAMFQIKSLATILKLAPTKVLKDIALRHRRKIYCNYDKVWYQFPTPKDVLVPYQQAKEYSIKERKFLSKPVEVHEVNFASLKTTSQRIPVVAILGHFNHGKTTLIDAVGGTSLVEEEAHAITQVWCRQTDHRI